MSLGRRWVHIALTLALEACGGDGGSTGGDATVEETTTDVVDALDALETAAPDLDVSQELDDSAGEVEASGEVETETAAETSDAAPEIIGACGDGRLDPGEDCDDGDLDDLDGCDRHCAMGRVVRAPRPGEIVINELMINPAALPDPLGEWIELASVSSDELNLSGCALVDDGTDRVPLALEGGRVLASGALFLIAGDAALAPGLVMTTMLLDDANDEVALVCDEVLVDRVAWSAFTWPVISGRALSLDPSRKDVEANDDVASWCTANGVYRTGDRGSPGAHNPACSHLDRAVDRCRLLGAASASGFADAPVPFDVEVEELGLTDLTPAVDVSPELLVEVGSAPGLPDPGAPEGFSWVRAAPSPGYQAPVGSRADVWRGEVVGPAGTRRVMARASRDAGASWLYCDRDGSDSGVTLEQLTVLSIGPSPCSGVSCNAPPVAACAPDGVHLQGFDPIGRCVALTASSHECTHAPARSDCGALGRICESGPTGAFCGAVPRTPEAGELLIAELMIRPTAVAGQWLELRSLTQEPLLLTGCVLTLSDADGPREWVLEAPTVVGSNGLLVVGESGVFEDNGGLVVDRTWADAFGDAGLPTAGTLTLACGDPLDEVTWDASWPGVAGEGGAAASLSPLRLTPTDNDAKEGWCRATASYGGGDRGTPGGANASCPGDVVPVESCRLGTAAAITPPAGTQASIPVRVVARTWTAKTLKTDPNPKLRVEVGFAPRGATAGSVASWFASAPDTGWTASGGGVDPAEDRYLGSLRVPAPGAWDVYARATADGGNTWAYCDRSQIIAPTLVGEPLALDPVASACAPDPCGVVPPASCRPVASGSPVEVVESSAPATCEIVAGQARCSYVETVAEDCAVHGAVCGVVPGPDGARCTGFPRAPEPGEVVISELLIAAGGLELGEWIELQSVADDTLDLSSCGLRSGRAGGASGDEAWDFGTPLTPLGYVVAPGAAVTVARSGSASVNGGAEPIMVTSGIALDNAEDWLQLVCTQSDVETVIDAVAWSVSGGWVIPQLTSLQLSGATLDARSNDFASSFCAPGITSPRAPNRVCPGDRVLDDCRVNAASTSVVADTELAVSVVVHDPGVTDLRATVDPAIGMLVEVGLGPESEAPMGSFQWHWVELEPDEAWHDRTDPSPLPGWDRWLGATSAGVVGTLRLLGRVSLDRGATWVLCGASGLTDGAAGGRMITSRAGACTPSPCTTPPAATCSGATLTGYAPRGDCAVGPTASCTYPSETFSCASFGGCNAGLAGCNATPATPTAVGSLVISELMRDSTLPAPDGGEWVELHNAGLVPLDLRGCELVDGAGTRLAIARGVPDVVLAGGHAVFAHSADPALNGGIPTSLGKPRSLGPLTLGNLSGSLAIACEGVEIDRVSWSFGWPGRTGVAMQLDRLHIDASANDLRGNWCAASPSYGTLGNKGSPGSLNPSCPP